MLRHGWRAVIPIGGVSSLGRIPGVSSVGRSGYTRCQGSHHWGGLSPVFIFVSAVKCFESPAVLGKADRGPPFSKTQNRVAQKLFRRPKVAQGC